VIAGIRRTLRAAAGVRTLDLLHGKQIDASFESEKARESPAELPMSSYQSVAECRLAAPRLL
jgi:hypothetical protein